MTPDALHAALLAAATALDPAAASSPAFAAQVQLRRVADDPARPAAGPGAGATYRTNAALRLAPLLGRPAPDLARLLAARLSDVPGVVAAEPASDGFVTVEAAALDPVAVLHAVGRYGADGRVGGAAVGVRGRVVVAAADGGGAGDAAPSLAWARRAVAGDALARVLRAEGADVVVTVPDAGTAAWCERLGVRAGGGDGEGREDIPAGVSAARGRGGERLDEALDRVGVDALRWAMVAAAPKAEAVLDLGLLGRRTDDNPVFCVQLAAAHAAMTLRHAEALGVGTAEPSPTVGAAQVNPREGDLVAELAEYPAVVARAARRREATPIPRHLLRVAAAYHALVRDCAVLPLGDQDVTDVHRFRLTVTAATRTVLGSGLGVLGVFAPERV